MGRRGAAEPKRQGDCRQPGMGQRRRCATGWLGEINGARIESLYVRSAVARRGISVLLYVGAVRGLPQRVTALSAWVDMLFAVVIAVMTEGVDDVRAHHREQARIHFEAPADERHPIRQQRRLRIDVHHQHRGQRQPDAAARNLLFHLHQAGHATLSRPP
jgi:hypothetical protein